MFQQSLRAPSSTLKGSDPEGSEVEEFAVRGMENEGEGRLYDSGGECGFSD